MRLEPTRLEPTPVERAPADASAPLVLDAATAQIFAIDAAPPAPPPPTEYRVRISNPKRLVTIAHDDACGPNHASCKSTACFVLTSNVDNPASPLAMAACTRDSDCVKRTPGQGLG
jgi:hypothetical protein